MPRADAAARWVRPEIQALSAYHVPPAAGLIKLDAMENPYGWPEAMTAAWLERLRAVEMNRYPDPSAGELKAALRRELELPQSAGLLLGNGSDELIQMIALALSGPDRVVLAPEPSFVMYRMIAVFAGMRYVGVPLRDGDFALDRAAMLAAIAAEQPAVVFLAYPNNPTGNLFGSADLDALLEAAPGLVVVDEAYAPFAEASCLELLGRHPNLVVMRTLSKLGLAGLRLGLLAGAPAWLDQFEKLRLPYNVGVLNQVSAAFALEHAAVFAEQTARIRAERGRLQAALAALPGLTAYPSRANFILLRVPPGRARELHAALRDAGVLVKLLDGAGPQLADCLRVTVGRPDENDAFLAALRLGLD
ncbi:MAG TPA: histidinol-phosphate transaminase [Gammaproteobacteria bacterium]